MMQIQHWLDCDRLLIIDGQCHGSVQVDILKTRDLRDRYLADALLWALWTDPDHRGKGTARRMMETAEREAAARGCRTMALTWDRREAAGWTLQWYERMGYEKKELGRYQSLIVKQIGGKIEE